MRVSNRFCRAVVQALVLSKQNGESNLSVRSYSGRAMYGRECIGVVGDFPLECLAVIVPALIDQADELPCFENELEDFLASISMDSMGLQGVVYFTNAPWTDDLDAIIDNDGECEGEPSEEEWDNDECVDRD